MKEKKTAPDLYETFGEVIITDQEHEARLDRYSKAKEHQRTVVDYIAGIPELSKEHKALSGCGGYLVFQRWFETNFRKLVGGFSCKKHLLCQPCALRRDSRHIRDYSLKIQQVLTENPHLIPVLITRTVANGPDLAERYKYLGKIHKKLLKNRTNSLSSKSGTVGRSADSVMQYVAGSVGTYEFKRGKNSGNWHPHIHEVAFLEPVFEFTPEEVPGWIRDEDGEWRKATRTIQVPREFVSRLAQEYWLLSGDSYIVDCRKIELDDVASFAAGVSGFSTSDEVLDSDNLKMVKALCEVFKYALKFGELSVEDQVSAYRVLKGRRLIFSYGCLRGVKVDDNLTDKAVSELEIGPYVYELYKSYADGYKLLKEMSADDYEEMDDAAKLNARKYHLDRREERLSEEDYVDLPEPHGGRIFQADMDDFVEGSSALTRIFSAGKLGCIFK